MVADFARLIDFARFADFARLMDFARFTDFARLAFFETLIAVTILPAGAAGDAAADLETFPVAGLGAEDLIIDLLEIAMIVTSELNLNFSTT